MRLLRKTITFIIAICVLISVAFSVYAEEEYLESEFTAQTESVNENEQLEQEESLFPEEQSGEETNIDDGNMSVSVVEEPEDLLAEDIISIITEEEQITASSCEEEYDPVAEETGTNVEGSEEESDTESSESITEEQAVIIEDVTAIVTDNVSPVTDTALYSSDDLKANGEEETQEQFLEIADNSSVESETEADEELTVELDEVIVLTDDIEWNNDDAFTGYVDQILYGSSVVSEIKTASVNPSNCLNGIDLIIYNLLLPEIQAVASGSKTSTEFEITLENLGLEGLQWTAEDLGVESIVTDGAINQDASSALKKQELDIDFESIVAVLLFSCPYDMYWYDKTNTGGVSIKYPSISAKKINGEWYIYFKNSMQLRFSVAQEFAADTYLVDGSTGTAVNNAAENARQIVADYQTYSDYAKLNAYRQIICDMVSYNSDVADSSSITYGNPWQLIWVFDGDSSTNVVCEGYSKAYQYLCDLSTFQNSNINCIMVSGLMTIGSTSEGHMWNIITMDDGLNYLVDITNCDTGHVGYPDNLFLVGSDGSPDSGYSFVLGKTVTYTYDSYSFSTYGDGLALAANNYIDISTIIIGSGICGDNMTWTLYGDGRLVITGTGEMYDWDNNISFVPWNSYASAINEVAIDNGVINIGNHAFENCYNLKEFIFPDGMTEIGDYAFYVCSMLESVTLPNSISDIGTGAFESCNNLADVYYKGTVAEKQSIAISDPDESNKYLNNAVWHFLNCEHVYIEETIKMATCTETGVKTYTCSVCGDSYTEEIPAMGHTYEEEITKKATVTEAGEITYTCSVCGDTYTEEIPAIGIPDVQYRTHVQTYGWQDWVENGSMAGTSGESKRLEMIEICLDGQQFEGSIRYRTHVQTYGWLDWVADGAGSGTEGEAKRLEAIQIELTDEMAEQYDVYYRVHAQHYGWLGWAKNGEMAGTSGFSYRLEAIEIVLVESGGAAPGSTAGAYYSNTSGVQYRTHVQTYGWQDWKANGAMSGTSGESKRLEMIQIQLTNQNYSGGVQYRTHVQTYGWLDWVADGTGSGTEGEAKRLEAIQIQLTGAMANHYDIYYRVHAQHFGWMGWAVNGQQAGTAGYAYRLEGIEIRLVPKGGAAPGSTSGCFIQK